MFGLENCVDFISSVVVFWRFFAPATITAELEAKLQSREKRASVAISMILVALGLGIWITAIADIMRGQEDPGQQNAALAISFISFVVFIFLAIFKFHYAKALQSPSLYKDGICSMIGTVLSASLFIDTLIITAAPSAWLLDPIVAIGCGLASFVYGMWTLYKAWRKEGVPIFSLRWWFLSRGAADAGGEETYCDEGTEQPPGADGEHSIA